MINDRKDTGANSNPLITLVPTTAHIQYCIMCAKTHRDRHVHTYMTDCWEYDYKDNSIDNRYSVCPSSYEHLFFMQNKLTCHCVLQNNTLKPGTFCWKTDSSLNQRKDTLVILIPTATHITHSTICLKLKVIRHDWKNDINYFT
jgi:hypothetical protein